MWRIRPVRIRASSGSDLPSTGRTRIAGRLIRMSPVTWRMNCGMRLMVRTGRPSASRSRLTSSGHCSPTRNFRSSWACCAFSRSASTAREKRWRASWRTSSCSSVVSFGWVVHAPIQPPRCGQKRRRRRVSAGAGSVIARSRPVCARYRVASIKWSRLLTTRPSLSRR